MCKAVNEKEQTDTVDGVVARRRCHPCFLLGSAPAPAAAPRVC